MDSGREMSLARVHRRTSRINSAFLGLAFGLTFLPAPAPARWPGTIDLTQHPPDAAILGAKANDSSGHGLACGDFNGDGINDVALLSQGQLGPSGFAFFHVLWGGAPLPPTLDLAGPAGQVSVVRAAATEIGLWSSRIVAGDFNRDGYDDIALSVPCQIPYGDCDGKIYVICGVPAWPDTLDLAFASENVTVIFGPEGKSGDAGTVMTTGDMDGDSYDDLVLAAPFLTAGGQVYIIHGRPLMPASIHLGSVTNGVVRVIDPRYKYETGLGLACGDVNRDGFDELLVGTAADEVVMLYGGASIPDTVLVTDPSLVHFQGSGEGIEWPVAIADFNGDGYGDIVLAASAAGPLGCDACGAVYVVNTANGLPDSVSVDDPTAPIVRLIGGGHQTNFGIGLATGDVDGDGYDDIAVLSLGDAYDPASVGGVTVVYGSATPPDSVFLQTDPTLTRIFSPDRSNNFGDPLSFGAGLLTCDVNGGGISDLLIGAEDASPLGRVHAGETYVLLGDGPQTSVGARPVPGGLFQNYPNPFNPQTTLAFSLAKSSHVDLRIYDVHGELVTTLLNEHRSAGVHRVVWDGLNQQGQRVASGVYFYRLVAGSFVDTKKMMVLK